MCGKPTNNVQVILAQKVESLVIIKRNKSKPLALVDAEYFINLHKDHGR
jgi:hypothetical protein